MTYPGGKGGAGVAQTLINLMPPHDLYVEPFLGAGAVLRAKRPAQFNIGIDRSPAALEMVMRDLRDRTAPKMMVRDPIGANGETRAAPELARTAGIGKTGDVAGGLAGNADADRRATPELALLQGNAMEWLAASTITPRALIYCDPPYVRSTRRSMRALYGEFEMTDAEHAKLLDTLLGLKCMVMVSGYPSALYTERLHTWNTLTFQTTVRSGALATEQVWFNYPRPVELHDYRYLGKGFRERERIKRKMKRWKVRLERMPELERQALLWAMRPAD